MKLLKFLFSKIFLKNLGISIVIGLALIFAILLWLKVITHHGKSNPVPDFYGLTPEEAQDLGSEKNYGLK